MADSSSLTRQGVLRRPSVLVVDDNDINLMTMRAVLESLDIELVCVTSGREALRTLLTRSFALILLDVNMPDLDGFETAGLIRERQTSESTPIIFVTAYGWDDIYKTRGYSLGAVDYIHTPIVPDILRSKVSVFVELYRQAEQLRCQSQHLAQRSMQLSALANQLADAEHRERQRISRVLHDHLQQLLVVAKMRLHSVDSKADDKLRGMLLAAEEMVDEAINAARSLAIELNPPILREGGLSKAMEDLARRFLKNHELIVQLKIHRIEFKLPEHILAFIYQSIRELLFNVVKHAGVSQASLIIKPVDGHLCIAVEDGGAGFVADSILSANSPADHFGLLSIRERLSPLNGDLDIDSRKGRGTRISLSIPIHSFPAECVEAAPYESKNQRPLQRVAPEENSIRILLADDHQMLRKGLVTLLESYDGLIVVGEAADGEEAVLAARDLMPDVVVMDMSMPRVNGVEATRRINSALPGTTIIGLSMHDCAEMASEFYDAGATNYFKKDGPPDKLVAAIRSARSIAR